VKYLIDSHVLIWLREGDRRLSKVARQLLESVDDTPVVSIVTNFELAAKAARGFVKPATSIDTMIAEFLWGNDGVSLPILSIHCRKLEQLPAIHGDPFDRMLVAQSTVESLPLVTGDETLRRYGCEIIW